MLTTHQRIDADGYFYLTNNSWVVCEIDGRFRRLLGNCISLVKFYFPLHLRRKIYRAEQAGRQQQ